VTVTVADLRAKTGTEFASFDDATIQAAIDTATLCLAPSAWGSRFDAGLQALSLHFLEADARSKAPAGGAPGSGGMPVTGALKWLQMGVIQKGYAGTTGSTTPSGGITAADAWLQSTSWGQKYLWLRSMNFPNRALP